MKGGPAPGRSVLQVLGPSSGGIRRHVAALASALEAGGWGVEVAGPAGVMRGLGRPQHDLSVGGPLAVAAGRGELRALAGRAAPSLVHAHGLRAGWLAAVSGLDVPVVVTVHNVVLAETRGPAALALRRLELALPRRVDAVIAVSAEIARRLPAGAVVVTPLGPAPRALRPPAEVRRAHGVGAGQPLVVTVARLHPQKDLVTLLLAAAAVRAARPEVRFVVAGDGPERARLVEQRRRLGLEAEVRFAGAVDNPADELAAADVVALSSLWEGSPLVVAEALLLGRPVVATAVGAVADTVADGVSGRLVPPRDPGALADALLDLLGDPEAAAAMAAAGRRVAEARFAPERLLDGVVAVYEGVLRR